MSFLCKCPPLTKSLVGLNDYVHLKMNNLSVIMCMRYVISKKLHQYIVRFCLYFKYLRQRDRLSVPYRPPRLQEVSLNQLLQFVPCLCLQLHWSVCFSKVTALAGTRVAQLRRSGMLRYACLSEWASACPHLCLSSSRSVCLFLDCTVSLSVSTLICRPVIC